MNFSDLPPVGAELTGADGTTWLVVQRDWRHTNVHAGRTDAAVVSLAVVRSGSDLDPRTRQAQADDWGPR